MQYMMYAWLFILIFAIVLEVSVPGLISIWFVPAALVAMLLAFFEVPIYLQITVFFGIAIILIVMSRTLWKKYTAIKPIEPTNTDIIIGKTGVVTADIDNVKAVGEVLVKGQHWSARSLDGEPIEKGAMVKILSIEGVKVICERAQQ